jgi:hypothetical protein
MPRTALYLASGPHAHAPMGGRRFALPPALPTVSIDTLATSPSFPPVPCLHANLLQTKSSGDLRSCRGTRGSRLMRIVAVRIASPSISGVIAIEVRRGARR